MTKDMYNLLRVPRNKGILGQEIFFIKNKNIIWSLKVEKNLLLGKYSLDEGQNWSPWLNLVFDYDGYFSFTIHGDNTLHLVCKNLKGNLIYIFWREEEVTAEILGENFLLNERIIYQTIVLDTNENLHLIYFTENPFEQIWRIKYSYKGESWNMPIVIDEGIGTGHNQGAASLAPDGTIHLIYQVFDNQKYQLIHIENNNYQWGNKKTITSSNRNNLSPSIIFDHNNTLHLTWIKSDGQNYRIMYRNKLKGGWMVGGWKNDKILSSKGVNAYSPTIGIIDHKVLIIWQQIDGIYECYSLNDGESFSNPAFKNNYDKLVQRNFVSLDLYRKYNLNSITSFDTGSTSVALLATLFQNDDKEITLNLPEQKNKRELVLPNMEHLSIDYGQKDLEEYLNKINGNFHHLFFETEDVRLTNIQMRETIEEKSQLITVLNTKLLEKEAEKVVLKDNEKKLIALVDNLKKDLNNKKFEYEENKTILNQTILGFEENKKFLENTLKEIKEDNNSLQKLHHQDQHSNKELIKQITMKNLIISELEEREENLKGEIELLKNTPLWKKLIRGS
ncbi:hypothetical protein SAMN00017405_2082 [Desulfonispora thiosulfatigenes DSM 11270]|uniref:Uncharacterized protein n=1 Tax=Desulfonispora thiosulfatigenes DSM 11270 TaxID=656914 RepID=A0A1W1VH10_DESTI|nr:hypothetical protein [Desulfonispora thiosulfatigenes]SMB92675.1 hypothetical protein SAMN00017405_2082 [Desulfonispora thiosulfatigenes DSM 11270]